MALASRIRSSLICIQLTDKECWYYCWRNKNGDFSSWIDWLERSRRRPKEKGGTRIRILLSIHCTFNRNRMNDNSKLFVTIVLIKLWNTTNVISISLLNMIEIQLLSSVCMNQFQFLVIFKLLVKLFAFITTSNTVTNSFNVVLMMITVFLYTSDKIFLPSFMNIFSCLSM